MPVQEPVLTAQTKVFSSPSVFSVFSTLVAMVLPLRRWPMQELALVARPASAPEALWIFGAVVDVGHGATSSAHRGVRVENRLGEQTAGWAEQAEHGVKRGASETTAAPNSSKPSQRSSQPRLFDQVHASQQWRRPNNKRAKASARAA